MATIVFIVLQLGFAILIFYLCLAFVTGAPFVPTTNKAAQAMIDLARIKQGMKVYDLGSGDGRLLFLAAKRGATAVGLEINPLLVLYTILRAPIYIEGSHTSMVQPRWKNFWKANISDADVVFVYLLPWRMEKLALKLKKECTPGSTIVSNSFIFPGWKIIRQDKLHHIYVFKI